MSTPSPASAKSPPGEGSTATLDPGPKTQEALTCVDAKTGKIVWQHLENMYVRPMTRSIGSAGPTPSAIRRPAASMRLGTQAHPGLLRRQNRRSHLETPDDRRIRHDLHLRRTNRLAGHRRRSALHRRRQLRLGRQLRLAASHLRLQQKHRPTELDHRHRRHPRRCAVRHAGHRRHRRRTARDLHGGDGGIHAFQARTGKKSGRSRPASAG